MHRPDFRVGRLVCVLALFSAACTSSGPQSQPTTTLITTTSTTSYDVSRLDNAVLASLAGCQSRGSRVEVITADLTPAEGDESIAGFDCGDDDLGRVLVFEGPAGAQLPVGDPIVGRAAQVMGSAPVRLLTYSFVGDVVFEALHRWDEGELRLLSEVRLTLDDYLALTGEQLEPIEPVTRADLIDRASPAVARLTARTCDDFEFASGTGFLISPRLIVTAAHVVEGSKEMEVLLTNGNTVTARTIGFAPGQDTALIELTDPIAITPLPWSSQDPRVGSDITVLGYPLDLELSATAGTISGVGRTIRFPNGEEIPNVLQTDASTNPGNSGGPWLDDQGAIIALHIAGRDNAQGINYGVEAAVVQDLVDQWEVEPQPYEPCAPPESFLVIGSPDHPSVDDVRAMLSDYAGGITVGDYALAHARLWKPTTTVDRWSADLSTSVWSDVEMVSIDEPDPERVADYDVEGAEVLEVSVRAVTNQAPRFGPDGQSCTVWSLDYLIASSDGSFWQIVSSKGSVPIPC